MSHPLLDHHTNIAWDIDGTLINGPNSSMFRQYIINHPEKTHYLVTFRDFDWAQQAYQELAPHGISREMIAGIMDCPHKLQDGSPNSLAYYMEWKGKVSAEIGCTVLVDDMDYMVMSGCLAHGVTFVHSHDPAFGHPDA